MFELRTSPTSADHRGLQLIGDPLSTRPTGSASPQKPRGRLTDDRHVARIAAIGVGEQPSAQQRHVHHAEEVRADDAPVDRERRIGPSTCDGPTATIAVVV